MSEVRGWSHNEMMALPWRLFLRYYGYWYQDRLREEDELKRAKWEAEQEKRLQGEPRDWKPL